MFILPKLPYKASDLEPHIDTKTMQIHHGKHHAAYVENLNNLLKDSPLLDLNLLELVKNLERVPVEIRQKVRNNSGGHLNHSLFWEMMSPSKRAPKGGLLEAINRSFGDLDTFKEKFSGAAMGRFGSGWAWLVKEKKALAIVDSPNQDTPLMEGKRVILGLDVWEHAYYLRYQNRRSDYIKAWWNVVNWAKVEALFNES